MEGYDLFLMIVWMSGMAGCDGGCGCAGWVNGCINGWMLGAKIAFMKALAWYLWWLWAFAMVVWMDWLMDGLQDKWHLTTTMAKFELWSTNVWVHANETTMIRNLQWLLRLNGWAPDMDGLAALTPWKIAWLSGLRWKETWDTSKKHWTTRTQTQNNVSLYFYKYIHRPLRCYTCLATFFCHGGVLPSSNGVISVKAWIGWHRLRDVRLFLTWRWWTVRLDDLWKFWIIGWTGQMRWTEALGGCID